MEIVRAGIEALSDGSVVLPTPAKVRQQLDKVRQRLSDSLLEARITEMLTRNTEPLLGENWIDQLLKKMLKKILQLD
jgi:hypothetical protein